MDLKVDAEVVAAYPDIKVSTVQVTFGESLAFSEQAMELKRQVESSIRSDPANPESLDRIGKYNRFYKKFGSGVPMEFQRNSIIGNKEVPAINPILTCMFLAELKNVVLTAGHDVSSLGNAIAVSLSKGDEEYNRINGKEQKLKPEDVFANDGKGIISSVLYGPDSRTKINGNTRRCLFMCYAFGLTGQEVRNHMTDITDYLRLLSCSSIAIGDIMII